MPPRHELPLKARKVTVSATAEQSLRFTTAEEIRRNLRLQDEGQLIKALNTLRNQLSVKNSESTLSPSDERLALLNAYLQSSPGADEIFGIWENVNSRQMSLLSAIVSVLATIISLSSTHYTHHANAQPIIKALLSEQWGRHLNSYLGGAHTELILVTIKLFLALSTFAGGRERKAVLDCFAWETKSLPKLLYMRRKGKDAGKFDMLARPDIRTLYILFLLSFIETSTVTSVKAAFLEQRRDHLVSIFKGLPQDSYTVIRKVLEVCWVGIWLDPKVKRTLKVGLFNESTLSHIIKIYDRDSPEDAEAEQIPADLVHHFLLAICVRPGTGVCFKDRGWYPRDSEDTAATEETSERYQKGGKIYNKILANILKILKANEDLRQQELTLKILAACPELVASYWAAVALTLEPRLSSRWIANIALLGSIVSLPVPRTSFLLTESPVLYHPTPPPLAAVLENILPGAQLKIHLTRALQSPSSLVKHCAALALAKCLMKYDEVIQAFGEVEKALEEDADGQWSNRHREIEREVRRRVPDFQVIVAFSQQKILQQKTDIVKEGAPSDSAPSTVKAAMLSESAQRLLWLYHRCLPSLVSEARFDAGKLLQVFHDSPVTADQSVAVAASPGSTLGLDTLRQLHVLRLLRESDQFTWSGRTGSSPHSNLYTLLKVYVATDVIALRSAITSLLRHILATNLLFQHDVDEVDLWLTALPSTRRALDAEAPDGAHLLDEGEAVIVFLDDCVQRCVKTPYQYLEDVQALWAAPLISTGTDLDSTHLLVAHDETSPSPLLATVIEQLRAKHERKLFAPSDTLAIVTFVRRLIINMAGKVEYLDILDNVGLTIDAIIQPETLFEQFPSISAAITRQVAMLHTGIQYIRTPLIATVDDINPVVELFLSQVEDLSIPSSAVGKQISVYELVDWLRFVDPALHRSELKRLTAFVERVYPLALNEYFAHIRLNQDLWSESDGIIQSSGLAKRLSFETLFLHCGDSRLADPKCRQVLVESAFAESVEVVRVRRASRLVNHRLLATSHTTVRRDLLLLHALIAQTAKTSLLSEERKTLKQLNYECDAIKLCCSQGLPETVRAGLNAYLAATIGDSSDDDHKLISPFTMYWSLMLLEDPGIMTDDQVHTAVIWIRYMRSEEVLASLDSLIERANNTVNNSTIKLIEALLQAMVSSSPALEPSRIRTRLPRLLALRPFFKDATVLESVISAGVCSGLPLGHEGSLPSSFSLSTKLNVITSQAVERWSHRTDAYYDDAFTRDFFEPSSWTDSTVEVIVGLLYSRPASRLFALEWLKTSQSTQCSVHHLSRIIHALFDYPSLPPSDNLGDDQLVLHFTRLVQTLLSDVDVESHAILGECVSSMVELLPSLRVKMLGQLRQAVKAAPLGAITAHALTMGIRLSRSIGALVALVVEELTDCTLRWAAQAFSGHEKGTREENTTVDRFVELLKLVSNVKPHLVEPVVTAAIQDRLSDSSAIRLVHSLMVQAQLKPAAVNKCIQNIVQHQRLYSLCASTNVTSRESIVDLLHVLFHQYPINTCQPTHIEPLARIYGGTLSLSDRRLLSIFQLFETTRKTSTSTLFSHWSSTPDIASANTLEAAQSLDPVRVFKTCLAFPKWRRINELVADIHSEDAQLYDPIFVTLLFTQMLVGELPSSALGWVQLFRTNIVSLLIRALSSKDDHLRDVATGQLAGLYNCLQDADMQERPHVLYILNLLKDALPASTADPLPPHVPAYTTLLLAHALRGVFYPSSFIYPLTARFLLQRPTLDISDVPMLFGMLYSADDDWKRERTWMVRFISEGMEGGAEWRVLKRRHTWELLASLYQAEERDSALRMSVLAVLAKITCNAQATTSLVLRSALLSWIEMQLRDVRQNEGLAWVKILENIVSVVDAGKMNAATKGEWATAISRCLCALLDEPSCTAQMFIASVPVALRLSLLLSPPTAHLARFLVRALVWLRSFEVDIDISTSTPFSGSQSIIQKLAPPHAGHGLWEMPEREAWLVWGECIEELWRVTMTLPAGGDIGERQIREVWSELTARILVWRALVGREGSDVGEWARQQVLINLSESRGA